MAVHYKLYEQIPTKNPEHPGTVKLIDHHLETGAVFSPRQSLLFGDDNIEPRGGIFVAQDGTSARVHHNSLREFIRQPGGITVNAEDPKASCFLRAKVRQPDGAFSTEPRLLRIDVTLTSEEIIGTGQHQQSRR